MVKNLQRLSAEERAAVRVRSAELLGRLDGV